MKMTTISVSVSMLLMFLNNMKKDFGCSVKLKASNMGSAVLVKEGETYYLLTAAHLCEDKAEKNTISITDTEGAKLEFSNLNRVLSPSKDGADICIMKLPADVAMAISEEVRCAMFEGSGYPCEIDGYPSNASDKRMRIEDGCKIAKETEVGDGLYVELKQPRADGLKLQDVKNGLSGSGVFVDSNGEKYLIGIVYRVEEANNLFIGWKMQKINDLLKREGWEEIPLIPIELRQQLIEQYNNLIRNSEFVLSRIKNKIIGQVQLPRNAYKTQLEEAISDNRIVIITGEAGIGKSALAKEALSNPEYKSVAVVGDDLDEDNERSILNHWEISDKLQDIYKSPIWGKGVKVLLIESAERMLNGNSDTSIVFIEELLNDIPDLKVVFTIRKNTLDLFRVMLQGNGIFVPDKSVIDVGALDDEELKSVEEAIPTVKQFMDSEKAHEILRNPFYLNLACSIATTVDFDSLKGSELKDLLCRQIVSGKQHNAILASHRINTLIDIARRTSAVGMNLVKCEMTEAVVSLANDDVLVGNLDAGYLRPGHDILTDWGLYCYIESIYKEVQSSTISQHVFYERVDRNIASRNMLRRFIETHIDEGDNGFDTFIVESLSLGLDDFLYDDIFNAILVSEKGTSFLASIKPVLLRNNCMLLKRLANALSYMFRKVNWDIKDFLMKRGMIDENSKVRNSDYMLPNGKGWYTFVTFLYNNRDAFYALREDMIPLLLQCELVSLTKDEAPNLKQYVFSILAEDVNWILSRDEVHEKPSKEVIRLLFKWMDENPEMIKTWVENTLVCHSYKNDVIKRFLLISETLDPLVFINTYPALYKSLIRMEWMDNDGFVRDYPFMVHQSSGVTTTYKCFFYSHPAEAIEFLCEFLNDDIEKKKSQRHYQLMEVKVKLEDKEKLIWGDDGMWREYRGMIHQSLIRESLLMTFEKWLMDSINNHINKAPYALPKDVLLNIFDIVYNKCINVSAWGVLASVATRFPIFIGMKAMPIYSCREFILWDKTRLSAELMTTLINPHASKAVRKEVLESHQLPHRKKDLEWVILSMSMTDGFAEAFRKLVKDYKETATTYLEKVSASRMDIDQYRIIGKTEEGYIIQGSPSDDIKEEAEQNEAWHNQFNRIVETSNLSRKRYDDDLCDVAEWRDIYQIHKAQQGFMNSMGLVAALGAKKFWNVLDKEERAWCKRAILKETMQYVTSGQYQVYSEYSSDGLLYLLHHEPDDEDTFAAVLSLIDSIGENDTIFLRFETTFKEIIWSEHKELAEKIILLYLTDSRNIREDVDRFAHVCRLLPTAIEEKAIDDMVAIYCKMYFRKWTDDNINKYVRIWDSRIDLFCAEYMIAMPFKRREFIENIWLSSSVGIVTNRFGMSEDPISSVFNHYAYLATKENKESFWQLWEIVFEWYKVNETDAVLPSLMLNFEIMRIDLLNDWDVIEGSEGHLYKFLNIMPYEGLPYLSRLVCRTGFNCLMPECLRYIDKDILRESAADRDYMRRWQDAVEDLYDDAKTRDAIKRDKELRSAYMVILNGLISNGSAIAYMIREYYI